MEAQIILGIGATIIMIAELMLIYRQDKIIDKYEKIIKTNIDISEKLTLEIQECLRKRLKLLAIIISAEEKKENYFLTLEKIKKEL